VTAVSPTTGPLAGRETVTVTGQWFTGADLVAFSAIGGDTATQSVEAPVTGPIPADPANPFVPEDNQLLFPAPDATAMFSTGFTGLRQAHTIVDVPVTNSSAAITSSPGTADVFSFPSVEVTDLSGPGVPQPRPAGGEAEDGRGLHLVARLAAGWGWRRHGGQTVTWFEIQALLQPMQHSAVSGKGLDSPDVDVSGS